MNIKEKIEQFAPCAEMMPGVVVIHELEDFQTVFMTSNGLEQLGINLKELQALKSKYHERFFNNEDMEDFMKKLQKLLQENDPRQTFTFFQQVKFKDRGEWVWHIASVRIFAQDQNGDPSHTVTVAFPVDRMKHIPHKAERLLAENLFFKKNLNRFLSLGKREKEVLKLVALGKSSAEIAHELCIAVDTVNTHRKKIKNKLGISTSYEFTEYAHAYDLI